MSSNPVGAVHQASAVSSRGNFELPSQRPPAADRVSRPSQARPSEAHDDQKQAYQGDRKVRAMTSSLRVHHFDGEYDDTSLSVSFDTLQDLVAHAQNLKNTIQALRQPAPNTQANSNQVQAELADAEKNANELCDFLGACWEMIPVTNRPSARSAVKAQKVFDTPELLENICIHLNPLDTLVAQQVGRVWRDGINSSVKIQRAIGLRPDESSYFSAPFADFDGTGSILSRYTLPGFFLDNYGPNVDFDAHEAAAEGISNTQAVKIQITADYPVSIGSRCRLLSLCQPPIKSASMFIGSECDGCITTHFEHEAKLVSEDGVNVGQIMDAAQQLIDAHRMGEEHVDGYCRPIIEFHATVTLADDDPIMVERRMMVASVVEDRRKPSYRPCDCYQCNLYAPHA
ncbi:hypothetical protein M409DRAFT_49692 [Zasmidium cellare ATCC 36951]|uniref:F-box domain-containing protein n=1 Tax=Zasmidium cellare ATCC 36951 TaxID=1080233 RepID=A0A6A6D219_ZASCE|nr:uncharacterized protein M409DRAFT_49692 [Zasmidium cellare ATCC 36951]KAF2173215.1 hypothetical protein M409DRAFT_49692 [Zasmidium cellare ATCC 36951]